MVNFRIESLTWFAAMGGMSAATISFIVFGFDIFITYIYIGFAIFFSGLCGYFFGHHFGSLDKESIYKAMLLGIGITLLAVVASAFMSAITSVLVLDNITQTAGKTNTISETFLLAGIGVMFSAPIVAPIGALTGYFIHKPCDDD